MANLSTKKSNKTSKNIIFDTNLFNYKDMNIKEIKANIKNELEKIRAGFESAVSIHDAYHIGVEQRSLLIDHIIQGIFEHLKNKLSCHFTGTLIATGGYGRESLAPYSDLDLCFITDKKATKNNQQYIIEFEKIMWDLGFKPSITSHTIESSIQAAQDDLILQTSLLDHRFLLGSDKIYQLFSKNFEERIVKVSQNDFVALKLKEREARHLKLGDSRYHLEPNIKESKGGLRDLQTLHWLARHLFGVTSIDELVKQKILNKTEAQTFKDANAFLWVLRLHLHYLTGHAEERLLFDLQLAVAEKMRHNDEEPQVKAMLFMKEYFKIAKNTGHLTMVFCTALEEVSITGGATAASTKPFKQLLLPNMQPLGFPIDGHRITVPKQNHFAETPNDMVSIFYASLQIQLPLHPDAWKALSRSIKYLDDSVRADQKSNDYFLDILLNKDGAEDTLRHMNESGVLGAFIPDFGRIIAHMQYDRYHVYTADEHLIRAIGILHDIENGQLEESASLATNVFQQEIHSRRALYVAMLLHDIAKGRDRDHAIVGEEISEQLCPRLGLTAEETESVSWLVRNHLIMSDQALRRDLNDPRTIIKFAEMVQSPERLKLLYVLTVADIMAVGPDRWNNWKSSLLSTLYHKTMEKLTGHAQTPAARDHVNNIKSQVEHILGSKIKTETIFEKAPKSYWINFQPETVAKHFAYILSQQPLCFYERSPLHLSIDQQEQDQVTEVMFYTPDHKGLFTKLAGALALSSANIVDARIFTFLDGMALDVFRIQNLKGALFDNIHDLEKNVQAVFTEQINIDQRLTEKKQASPKQYRPTFSKPARVLIDNNGSSSNSIIEVNADDRPGLLYEITTCLTKLGLQITSAKIATYGQNIIDVFYVRDGFGLKILHTEKLRIIEEELLKSLNNPDQTNTQ